MDGPCQSYIPIAAAVRDDWRHHTRGFAIMKKSANNRFSTKAIRQSCSIPLLSISVVLVVVTFSISVFADGLISPHTADFKLENQDLVIQNGSGDEKVRINAATGQFNGRSSSHQITTRLDPEGANLFIGGGGSHQDGDVLLFSEGAQSQDSSSASIHLNGGEGSVVIGGAGETGSLVLQNRHGKQRVFLSADYAALILGNGAGQGKAGQLQLRDASDATTVSIDGAAGQLSTERVLVKGAGHGGSEGIDSASLVIANSNPAIALQDTSGNNTNGWYVQSSSTGRLLFQTGNTSTLGKTVLILNANGGVCLGACDN
jgi:hypothetical protein